MSHNQTIGLNIAKYRKLLNLSQQALADYLNVKREVISYYETAERTIPTKVISKIAKLFGVTEYDLYQSDSKESQLNFAFRANNLTTDDLESIAEFKNIAMNYLKMKRAIHSGK